MKNFYKKGSLKMILRKYYYIDEEFVQDAYSSILGFNLEKQEITESSNNGLEGGIDGGKIIKAKVGAEKSTAETVKYNADITITAKLQKILDCIKEESGSDIPYYESMDENDLSLLERDAIFEGVFNVKFTKIEQYSRIANMAQNLDQLLNLGKTDSVEAMDKIQSLAKKEREKGIACLMNFVYDRRQNCYMHLNEKYLRTDISMLNNELTVICKVSRIIPKGKTINLTDITELSKLKIPNTNTRKGRTQQVQQIKSGYNKNSMKDFQDEIKGPAIEIVPIAIYK